MWPDKPALVNCPHCMKTFWLEDAKQLAELDLFRRDAAKHWETAKVVVDPVETNYLAAANAPGVKLDRELYARRHAWWLANDAVRRQADGQLVWNAAQRNNLQRLAALLSDKDSCEGLQKGEIFRELGNYDACIKLLDGLPTDSNTTKMNADILKNLAIQKKSTVARWP